MYTTGRPLTRAERRRIIVIGLLRGLVFAVAVSLVYFLAPLDRATGTPLWAVLTVGLVLFTAVTAYQVRAIVRAAHPAARAVEAITITAPLFLYMFAATYFVLSGMVSSSFNVASLTRVDALYFTVTVFSTVGFGDIAAASQPARILVTVQMVLDLILIGAVVRVFVAAARLARDTAAGTSGQSVDRR
jgi:voltage-gated potassium channel